MKNVLFLIALFYVGFTQGQLIETFDSLNNWTGERSKFESINGRLHLNDTNQTGSAFLVTKSEVSLEATWEFWLKLDFSPSASNRLEIALVSDSESINGDYNGYFIGFGESGTEDALQFYRKDGSINNLLGRGLDGRVGAQRDSILIKVSRDANFNWQIWSDIGTGYELEITVEDDTYLSSSYFGFYPLYTSTRSDLFYFDDLIITGEVVKDNDPPVLIHSSLMSQNTILLQFDESIDSKKLTDTSFVLNGEHPISTLVTSNEIILMFNDFETDIDLILVSKGVTDLSGNEAVSTEQLFRYHQNQQWDIIISEFMADPVDSVGLPEVEYVELYNRSTETIDLKGWKFSDDSKSVVLNSYQIAAGDYLILTAIEDAWQFTTFGNVMGLESFPSLNNNGDFLSLVDSTGLQIHQITYTNESYRFTEKSNGGYALELQDFDQLCEGELLLSASLNPLGGTPGTDNSGSYQALKPQVQVLSMTRDSVLILLNKPITDLEQLDNYAVSVGEITTVSENENTVTILFSSSLPLNTNIDLSIKLEDCLGQGLDTVVQLYFAEEAKESELVITEVLFNPVSGGTDYIEVYNKTDQVISSNNLELLTVDLDDTIDIETLDTLMFFEPNTYYVFTENKQFILDNYQIENNNLVIELDIPALNDDEGTLQLTNVNQLIDQIYFSDDLHAPYLKETEGVSLERIDVNTSGLESNNWYSAPESIGFGSPTQPNSSKRITTSSNFELDNKRISPDGDGYEDFALLNYSDVAIGTLVTITLFDHKGNKVTSLYQNYAVVGSGQIRIDGIKSSNKILDPGIYILLIETINLNGNIDKYKRTITVNSRF